MSVRASEYQSVPEVCRGDNASGHRNGPLAGQRIPPDHPACQAFPKKLVSGRPRKRIFDFEILFRSRLDAISDLEILFGRRPDRILDFGIFFRSRPDGISDLEILFRSRPDGISNFEIPFRSRPDGIILRGSLTKAPSHHPWRPDSPGVGRASPDVSSSRGQSAAHPALRRSPCAQPKGTLD